MKAEIKIIIATMSLFAIVAAGALASDELAAYNYDSSWDDVDGQYSLHVTETDDKGNVTKDVTEYYAQSVDKDGTTVVKQYAIYDNNAKRFTFEADGDIEPLKVAEVDADGWAKGIQPFPKLENSFSTVFQATFKGTDYQYSIGDQNKDSDVELMGFEMEGFTYSGLTVMRIDNSKIVDSVKPDEDGRYIYVDAVVFSVTVTPNDDPNKLYTATLKAPFVVGKVNITKLIDIKNYVYDGYKHGFEYTLHPNVDLTQGVMIVSDLQVKLPGSNVYVNVTDATSGNALDYGTLAGNYKAHITLKDDPLYYANDYVEWKIAPRDISKFEGNVDDVAQGGILAGYMIHITPVVNEKNIINSKALKDGVIPQNPYTITVNKIKGNYGGFTFTTKDVTSDGGIVVIKGTQNYTGKLELEYDIIPVNLEDLGLTLHVDTIHTDGTLDYLSFDDSNVFLFPIDKYYPNFNRNNYQIVVLNARGGTVIDEPNGICSGSTISEWNYIEIHGINGFEGVITGYFYEAFDGATAGIIFNDAGNKVIGYDGEFANVVIPEMNNGIKVTKIASKAFYNNKTIESVVIGDNVTHIGMKAFANCVNLKSIVIGDSVKVIYSYAFFGCNNIEDIDFGCKLTDVQTKAFGSVTFRDASGKKIDATAENLCGMTFAGSNKVLKLVD
jgi:hypothetical protein